MFINKPYKSYNKSSIAYIANSALKQTHKACHSAPAEVMSVTVSGKNSKENALTIKTFGKPVLSLFLA